NTTPPNFGQPQEPSTAPSTNPLFAAAEALVPNASPLTNPSEFDTVIAPFVAQAFAAGFDQSFANIGPMAIAEAPDGSFLISAGRNRGEIYHFSHDGGAQGTLFASLDYPIFNMAFDGE